VRSLLLGCVWLSALFITACGSGGGSEENGNGSGVPSSTAITHTLTGTAVKGVLKQASIAVYRLSNGQPAELLASGSSDEQGHFKLTVQNDPTDVLVVVSPAENGKSRMLCDALRGCGSGSGIDDLNKNGIVDFGEWGPMPAGLQLRSVVNAGTTTTLTTQITPLTELATAFAESFPQGIDDLSFQVAASQTSNLLGLTTNLTGLVPIDLTKPSALASADTNTLMYSLLGAALLEVAAEADFQSFLTSLSQRFVDQQGQLAGHDAIDGGISLADIFNKAMDLARHLNLNDAYSQLAGMKARYMTLASGELSSAAPSTSVANDKLTKAKTLVSNLDQWQDYLVLANEPVQSSSEMELMGTDLAPEFQKMLRSLAVAGQFGVLGAVPSVAINEYCGRQAGILSLLCFNLAKNLEDSCAAILSTQPNGQLFCNALNNLPIPASLNLVVTYHLLDKNVDVKGTLKGYQVALKINVEQISAQDVTLSFTGTLSGEEDQLTVQSGTVALHFDQVIDLSSLKLPSTARVTFDGQYTKTSAQFGEVAFTGHFDSNINLSQLNNSGTAFNDLDSSSLAVLSELPFDMTVSGNVSTSAGLMFATTLSTVSSGLDLISLSYTAANGVEYTQFGDAQAFENNLPNLRITENGETISLSRSATDPNQITLSNQDGVSLSIDLAAAEGSRAGTLTVQGQTYGWITRSEAGYSIRFGDLSTYSLQLAGN